MIDGGAQTRKHGGRRKRGIEMERRRVTFPAERRCEKAGAAAVAPAFASSRTTGENAKVEDPMSSPLEENISFRENNYTRYAYIRSNSISSFPLFHNLT